VRLPQYFGVTLYTCRTSILTLSVSHGKESKKKLKQEEEEEESNKR